MKTKIIIPFLGFLLLSSCIVKSLHPFYTSDKLSFNEKMVGSWTDSKDGQWEILSFKEEWAKETKSQTKLTKEDREAYERFKDGYVITYTKKDKVGEFIAMPFKIDEDLFLDFTPFYYDSDELNGLVAQHLFKTHSAAKIVFTGTDGVQIKFLSEEKVKPLFNQNNIRLKHEKSGVDEDLILTSPSEELYEFLKKFNRSSIEDRWEEDVYQLTRENAKP
jgi:hypothetical protein